MRKDVMLRPSSVSPHSGYFLLPAYPGPWHVRIPGRDTSGQTVLIPHGYIRRQYRFYWTGTTGLLDQEFSLPFCFIGKHGYKHSLSVIGNSFAEPECLLHGRHVLDGNKVIGIR